MPDDMTLKLKDLLLSHAVPILWRVVGAVILWIIGRIAISMIRRGIRTVLINRKLDAMLVRYLDATVGVLLPILLILMILNVFGVETTSFAALMAAAGVAIGMAWSGLLGHFAAGVFLVIFRPFKVGDMITVAGVTGVVHEVGLFVTTINTADNIRTFVGNNKVFSDTIQNYTTNPNRRVELKAQLAHVVNPAEAIKRLTEKVQKVPHALKDPAVSVELLEFTAAGPVLAVRPFCHNDHYWDVYFGTNTAIQDVCSEAGYPVPEQHYRLNRVG
jgi:small conductance mechanosensitive channel